MIKNHYWSPIKEVLEYNEKLCKDNNCEKVLEIGPGYTQFRLSNYFIDNDPDVIQRIENKDAIIINKDLDIEKIDHPDNFFDFGYARHIFEDVQNPDFIFKEFTRICSSGYIETPSPLVESLKNVCSRDCAHLYKGYIHHRYIMWTEDDTLHMIPKLPIIEYINFEDHEKLVEIADSEPLNWNNYYWWDKKSDKLPKFILHKQFYIPDDYANLLLHAINSSLNNNKNNVLPLLRLRA